MPKQQTARGVSDVIGFILVFALIMTSIGVVYATGFESLQGAREQEELRNVVRAYDILADNIQEVSRGEAPSRDTQLKLGDSQIYSADEITLTVRVTNTSGGTTAATAEMSPIVYETSAGHKVIYVNGAVIRGIRGQSVMVSDPAFIQRGGRLLIPMIDTQPANGDAGVAGGTIIVRTRSTGRTTLSFHNATESYSVEFTVGSTPRPEVWEAYCERTDGVRVESTSSSSVTCQYENTVTSAYIQFRRVEVIFDS